MYKYRLFSSNDSDAVRRLIKATFPNFLEGEYWDWKHLHNPRFDPSIVAIVEENGKIVGCSHWLQGSFKIAKGAAVKSLLTCDLAVRPGHRNRGVARRLLLLRRTREMFKQRGIVVNYDFADPRLAKKLYSPLLGYTKVRLSTKKYFKIISWKSLINSVSRKEFQQNLKRKFPKLEKLDLTIFFKTRSAPPLTISLSYGTVKASEEVCGGDCITVEGDLRTFLSLVQTQNVRRRLLVAILERKIKIKGSFSKLFETYRNASLLQALFKIIVTRATPVGLLEEAGQFSIRGYEDGDEIEIAQLFNKAYMNYGGFAPRTPEYWRWCCLERPDVERKAVLVVVDRHESIAGYAVVGKSGSIWELCYDHEREGEEIVSLLLDNLVDYLEKIGATSIVLNAPGEDSIVNRACGKFGFEAYPTPKMFVSVLDFSRFIPLLAESKKGKWATDSDETLLVKLKNTPFWINDTILMKVGRNGVQAASDSQHATIKVETDFITLTSLLFGIMSPVQALTHLKLEVEPFWKIPKLLSILSYLQMEAKWFFPLSDFG
jgi:ribosomal protein S18 acetylase RimI-like enzyme